VNCVNTRIHGVVNLGRAESGSIMRDRNRISCHWAVLNDQVK